MLIIHGPYCERKLLVWGEAAPEQPVAAVKPRRGRKPKVTPVLPLPYDAGGERLLAAIRDSLASDVPEPVPAYAWMPTVAGQPIPSSPLIAEAPASSAEPELAAWRVTALVLGARQAIDFLCGCVGKEILAPGVVVGKDIAFWAQVLRYAGSLVARQRYLPGMLEQVGTWRACWQPVFSGADADVPAKLAAALPASARALALDAADQPAASPLAVVGEFIREMVDSLVRMGSENTPVVETPPPPTSRSSRGRKRKPAPAHHSVHDLWMHALTSADGAMAGDPVELSGLAEQIAGWQRPVTLATAAPFRLCLRLDEPTEDEPNAPKKGASDWQLRFFLQSVTDPSLLVPAENAWKTQMADHILGRDGFNAREYLLLSLGQAAGLCPAIEASLKKARPQGCRLDASGAFEFLMERAAALELAGFGVLLPAWWTGKGTKLRLSTRAAVKTPSMTSKAGLSLDEIVQFDWQVSLGDEKLTLEELEALAALKAPLVKVRGQWVQMNADEIQAAINLWKSRPQETATAGEIVRLALGAEQPEGGIPFDGVDATGWLADVLAQLGDHSRMEELPAPNGFNGELRPYQARGFSWLGFLRRWGLGACLADDMGLGKTIQTLALIQHDWHTGDDRRPVLLICPTSVVSNWQKEAARFTPDLPVMIHHGTERVKGDDFREQAERHAIVVSSYALLHRDFDLLNTARWAGVILDEAQNIKNPETKQARAARAFKAGYRIALTGTPVENHVGELWSIMEFLNPGLLGTLGSFKRTFYIPIQANHDPYAAGSLKRITQPFILRRMKTDRAIISDLPDKLEMKVFCPLTREQASLYEAVARDAVESIDSADGIQRKGVVLATLSKLKQVCNHPAHFLGDNSPLPGRSGKLTRLTEMLEEIMDAGDRALVFTQFAEMGELLQRHVQETFGREVFFLHGGTTPRKRTDMVDRFQNAEDAPAVFILSLKAGGTGINLTRASHVFHFDRWWNPAVENQATDRAFRIGQTANVQVHKFICAGTLEDKIDEMIERKKDVAQRVVGTGESWLTELSTSELKDLFKLSREAVAG